MKTLQRMSALGTIDVSADAHRRQRQLLATGNIAVGAETEMPSGRISSSSSRLGEVPNQPFKDIEIQAALESAGGGLWKFQPRNATEAVMDPSTDPRDPLAYSPAGTGRGRALDGSQPMRQVQMMIEEQLLSPSRL